MVWTLRSHGREIVERKLNTCKTIKRVDGLARTTGKGKGTQDKGKGKGKPSKGAKAGARAKERVNNTARKGRRDVDRHELGSR